MSSEISSGNVQNDDYVSRPGQKGGPVPVVRDGAVEEGAAGEGDSDERLGVYFLPSLFLFLSNFFHQPPPLKF